MEVRDKTRNQIIRKRKEHKKHVSDFLRLIESRGQNPEDLLRSLEARPYETTGHRRFKPYSAIGLATFRQHPVEIVAERLPLEMEGSRAAAGETAPAPAAVKPDEMEVSPLSPSENNNIEMLPFISGRIAQT